MMTKAQLKLEAKRFLIYTLFLALIFGSFTTYERLILGAYSINFTHYGYGVVEAIILVKFILLGQRIKLGERYGHKSLIIPVMHKTLLFCLLVLIFGVLEHLIYGYYQGQNFAEVFRVITHRDLDAMLAKLLIMFFIFVLFFSFLELARVIGEEKLYKLFFKRNDYEG